MSGCRYLSKSQIPITLERAVSSGLTPCSVCKPPKLDAGNQDLYRVNIQGIKKSREADTSRLLQARVLRIVDGDTIVVQIPNPPGTMGNEETIRLIGVDTPETVHPSKPVEYFGKEASAYTREHLSDENVKLAFDWDLRDNYNRLLAYVYLANGKCFNAQLISEGYGFAYVTYPFQFMSEFQELEDIAKNLTKGLWKQ